VDDLGLQRACELAQNLARLVRSRVATEDEVRIHAGYSQRHLARDAAIKSQVTVKQVLDGQHFVRLDILMKLLTTLNVPISAVAPKPSVSRRACTVTDIRG
jgi:transcriptional regulator with XRE-family HTH domain